MQNNVNILVTLLVLLLCSVESNAQPSFLTDSSKFFNNDSSINNTFTGEEIRKFRVYIKNIVVNREIATIDTLKKMILIPDEATAISIAKIIFQRHDNNLFKAHKFFIAEKIDNRVWRVAGVFPKNYNGGLLLLEINIFDGQILYVHPGK